MKAITAAVVVVLGAFTPVGVRLSMAQEASPSTAHSEPLNLIEEVITLPDVKGRIDHFTADPKRKRLFLAAVGDNSVQVIDVFGGKLIRTITGFDGPKTPVFLPDLDKLVVISTVDAKVRIFDGQNYSLRKTIELPGDFEMIRYDPSGKKLYVGWGDPQNNGGIAVIDAVTEQRTDQNFNTGGSPEQFEVEANGTHIFANVPDAGNVVESIDRNTGEIKKWPIENGKKNIPMALDEADHRLFTVTRKPPVMSVLNTETGQVVASIPVAGDCADIFYDKSRKRIYAIGGWGYISVFQQKSPDDYELIKNVPTAPGARTGYFYAKRDLLYVGIQRKGDQSARVITYEPQK